MGTERSQFEQSLQQKLSKRIREGSLRNLPGTSELIDFSSNDYLGFARSEQLNKLISEKCEILPPYNGSTGSRLLSGNHDYTVAVEARLATYFKSEACLIFNSGYSANLAVLSSLPQRNDTLIYDELVHASMKDGARLGLASRVPFRHNNLNDLESKLSRAKGNRYVAIESVYSMDGDFALLKEICELTASYDGSIVLDEAHSTGIYGEDGSGLAISLNVSRQIPVRIYTFGKGLGIHGACVCGSKQLIDYLVNFARPFIYTTALPLQAIAAIDAAVEFARSADATRQQLFAKVEQYKSQAENHNLGRFTDSPIQTYHSPGNSNIKEAAAMLNNKGLDVRPILSPTVRAGSERLRVCLHAFNSEQEVDLLTRSLAEIKRND